jgi:hypothetical protein
MKKAKQKIKSNTNLETDSVDVVKPLPELPKKCPYPELDKDYDFLAVQPRDSYLLLEAISKKDQIAMEYFILS